MIDLAVRLKGEQCMKIAASNIAWIKEYDTEMMRFLTEKGCAGLEIAPTRIFEEAPYDHLAEAEAYAKKLKESGLAIPSLQSIWFRRTERLFGSSQEREILLEYTKKAIDFANAVNAGNLVFGCPRNRAYQNGEDTTAAVSFFKKLGEYAISQGTVVGMEANPLIYNTNYINTTPEAIELIRRVESKGFLLNLDVGTMIENKEPVEVLEGYGHLINHVHISEPNLAVIEKRSFHKELSAFLKENNYIGYVSLEVKTQEDISQVKEMILYLKEIFG